MAEVHGAASTHVAPREVWDFLLDISNWIREFDGYVGHEIEADGAIVVSMAAHVVFITKRSRLRVVLGEQDPPRRLRFTLEGLDDPLTGDGELTCTPDATGGTVIAFRVSLRASGVAAPLLEEFLERVVPSTIGDLSARISDLLDGGSPTADAEPRESLKSGARVGGTRLAYQPVGDSLSRGFDLLQHHRPLLTSRRGDGYDLIVVGSGGAGLTAAITAHDLGARVLVVEKSKTVGGTFAYSTGLTWVPNNEHMRAEGVADSLEDALAYIRPHTSGRHDEEVLSAFLNTAPETIAFLERAGVPFEVVPNFPDEDAEAPGGTTHGRYLASPLFPAASKLSPEWQSRLVLSPTYGALPVAWKEIQEWGGFGTIGGWDWDTISARLGDDNRAFGMSTAGYLLAAVLKRAIPIETETSATELVVLRGRVRGVRVDGRRGRRTLAARRGVILATGSYDNDAETKRLLEPHPPTIGIGARTVDGSGLVMALEHGARFALFSGLLVTPTYHILGEELDGEPVYRLLVREPGFPGSIIVNRAGQRFCDETGFTELRRRFAERDSHSGDYPNFPAFLIFDREWKERYPLGPLLPGQIPEWLLTGDSPADLAQRLGVDGDAMAMTIESFNGDARAGRDGLFGRGETAFSRANGDPEVTPNPTLRPLTPPLFGIELRLAVVGSNGGLVIDADARVRHLRGHTIAGLYAAGNAAANQIGGLWYNAGLMNARGMTFGYRGARHAMGAAGSTVGRGVLSRMFRRAGAPR